MSDELVGDAWQTGFYAVRFVTAYSSRGRLVVGLEDGTYWERDDLKLVKMPTDQFKRVALYGHYLSHYVDEILFSHDALEYMGFVEISEARAKGLDNARFTI